MRDTPITAVREHRPTQYSYVRKKCKFCFYVLKGPDILYARSTHSMHALYFHNKNKSIERENIVPL